MNVSNSVLDGSTWSPTTHLSSLSPFHHVAGLAAEIPREARGLPTSKASSRLSSASGTSAASARCQVCVWYLQITRANSVNEWCFTALCQGTSREKKGVQHGVRYRTLTYAVLSTLTCPKYYYLFFFQDTDIYPLQGLAQQLASRKHIAGCLHDSSMRLKELNRTLIWSLFPTARPASPTRRLKPKNIADSTSLACDQHIA